MLLYKNNMRFVNKIMVEGNLQIQDVSANQLWRDRDGVYCFGVEQISITDQFESIHSPIMSTFGYWLDKKLTAGVSWLIWIRSSTGLPAQS